MSPSSTHIVCEIVLDEQNNLLRNKWWFQTILISKRERDWNLLHILYSVRESREFVGRVLRPNWLCCGHALLFRTRPNAKSIYGSLLALLEEVAKRLRFAILNRAWPATLTQSRVNRKCRMSIWMSRQEGKIPWQWLWHWHSEFALGIPCSSFPLRMISWMISFVSVACIYCQCHLTWQDKKEKWFSNAYVNSIWNLFEIYHSHYSLWRCSHEWFLFVALLVYIANVIQNVKEGRKNTLTSIVTFAFRILLKVSKGNYICGPVLAGPTSE